MGQKLIKAFQTGPTLPQSTEYGNKRETRKHKNLLVISKAHKFGNIWDRNLK